MIILEQVISGGQTGVDQIALLIAQALGYKTGGTVPKGWRTDDGPAPWLSIYGCVESYDTGYRVRTIKNVRDADATVWFGIMSPGYQLTKRAADIESRHRLYFWLENPTAAQLAEWLHNPIRILNVGGNRAGTHTGAWKQAEIVLRSALRPD